MNTTDRNVESNIQLPIFAAPLITVAVAVILLLKGSATTLYLSWLLLVGTICCAQWRKAGLIGSLFFLVALFAFQYPDIPADQRLWHLGAVFAIGIAFFIVSLSYLEIESMVSFMQSESLTRLKNLLQMDQKLETVQGRCEAEKSLLSDQLRSEKIKSESYQRLIDATREEMLTFHAEQEKQLKELFEKRQEVMLLKDKLDESCLASKEQKALLQQKLEELNQELLEARNEGALAAGQSAEVIARIQEELKTAKETLAVNATIEQARLVCQDEKIDALTKAVEPVDMAVARWRGMYNQLREQFEEKDRVLHETRRALFQAEERVSKVEHERDQKSCERSEFEVELEQCVDELETECARLREEIVQLEELMTLSCSSTG